MYQIGDRGHLEWSWRMVIYQNMPDPFGVQWVNLTSIVHCFLLLRCRAHYYHHLLQKRTGHRSAKAKLGKLCPPFCAKVEFIQKGPLIFNSRESFLTETTGYWKMFNPWYSNNWLIEKERQKAQQIRSEFCVRNRAFHQLNIFQ